MEDNENNEVILIDRHEAIYIEGRRGVVGILELDSSQYLIESQYSCKLFPPRWKTRQAAQGNDEGAEFASVFIPMDMGISIAALRSGKLKFLHLQGWYCRAVIL